MFGLFDFSCLDDPEYKEDAIREDIIAPLLRAVGYSASKPHRIVRSRALTHPYVLFGSQKRRINIIPDYILEIDGKPCFTLDAKAPSEVITHGDNVSQVYSYAIHPEIRTWNYGLCNGRTLALFELTSVQPKHCYDLTHLDNAAILDINQKLNPRTLKNNVSIDLELDAGTFLHYAMNIPLDTDLHFPCVVIPSLGMVNPDHFTINVVCNDLASRPLMFTFDFNRPLYDKLLRQLATDVASRIQRSLSAQPFTFHDNEQPPTTHIHCRQTTEPQFSRTGEMFFPLRVIDFRSGLNKQDA